MMTMVMITMEVITILMAMQPEDEGIPLVSADNGTVKCWLQCRL